MADQVALPRVDEGQGLRECLAQQLRLMFGNPHELRKRSWAVLHQTSKDRWRKKATRLLAFIDDERKRHGGIDG